MSIFSALKGLFKSRGAPAPPGSGTSSSGPGGSAAPPPAAPASQTAPGSDIAGAPQGLSATAPQSVTPAQHGRVLLIHGYSAGGEDFTHWRDALAAKGIATADIEIANYVTLNNEVTIKDLGEAFDRALRYTRFPDGDRGEDWTFDAMVHSTGMLVLRQWLTGDPYPNDPKRSRVRRLKHLVGLAPATFGSPQAKKGRSWLGALVKGNKHFGPDFMNAGNEVLDGLELASRYTWNLAHKDMLNDPPLYNKGDQSPYVAVFIGNHAYDGIAALSNSPGCDGTVRWAGCSLDTRKITLDFRRTPQIPGGAPGQRYAISQWSTNRLAAPIIAVENQDHGSIVANPRPEVVDRVVQFFGISTDAAYSSWEDEALNFSAPARAVMDRRNGTKTVDEGKGWQQIVIHMVDDHEDGVTDYNLQIFHETDDPDTPSSVPLTADTYSTDNSYRCFYIQLTEDMLNLESTGKRMWVELIASSGSELIEYMAYADDSGNPQRLAITSHDPTAGQPVRMDITDLTKGGDSLFYAYTTTLMEIFVEREPMPLKGVSAVLTFPDYAAGK
ncbi:MAG TPA: hypothetical protein VGL22_15155 [Terracidiphilus sp.]|jgi:hypothetical protein